MSTEYPVPAGPKPRDSLHSDAPKISTGGAGIRRSDPVRQSGGWTWLYRPDIDIR